MESRRRHLLWGSSSKATSDSWLRRGIGALITTIAYPSPACTASAFLLQKRRSMWRLGLQQLQQQPAALQTRVDTPQERTTAANTETPAVSSPEPQREAAAAAAAAAAKEEAATATAAPAETEGAAATAAATATTTTPTAAAAAADAAAEKCFKLHFCDETNEPEDVCNAQWLVLWSYAVYTPEKPSVEEQEMLKTFFELFPDQCKEGSAANCYSEAVRKYPPRVSSRRDLVLWLCMIENKCREKTNAKYKPCRYSELMKRWRYSDGYV